MSEVSGFEEDSQQLVPPVLPEKEVVDPSHLVAGSFEFIGAKDKGAVRIKNSLPLEVEVKYVKKEDNSQPCEGDYRSVVPSDLSNGDKVHIKFYIKSIYSSSHKLPSSETGSFTNPIIFTVDGLKTQAQLNTVLNAINSLDETAFNGIYDFAAKNKLASDITNTIDKKAAIITMIKGKISDNVAKTLIVEGLINLVPLGGTGEKVIDIIGFKTQAELDKVSADADITAAKALFDDLKNADPRTETNLPAKTTTLPSKLKDDGATTATTIGFDNPLEKDGVDPKGVIATFSVKDVDDANGKLKVEVTLSKAPGKSETFRFTLIGYQTTSKANEVKEATEAIKAAKTLFSKLISDETQTNLPAKATTLPSKLETDGAASAAAIGFDNPLIKAGASAKGVTVTFSIKSVNDAKGTLVVEATLSKASGDAQTVEFTLTRYQKASPPKTSPPKTTGLSKGVIAGITIGASVFTFGLAFIVFRFLKSKK